LEFSDFRWVPIFLPFVLGLVFFRRFERSLKIFYLYIAYGTLNEVVTWILISFGLKNTMPLINLYQMVTIPILGIFYIEIINNKIFRKLLISLIIAFEIFTIINLLFLQGISEYPLIPRTIATFIVIILTIIYFYNVMIEAKIISLWNEPLIWINCALLISYSGNLFFTVLFNLILEYSREFSKLTVNYFSIIMILFYILISIGFWKAGKQKTDNYLGKYSSLRKS